MDDTEEIARAIKRVTDGDADAFRFIVRDYSLMIRSYLASHLYHADEMDDLAQNVFISAFESLDQYDGRGNLGAWLRGIARNQLLMHFRTVGRRNASEMKFREEVTHVIGHDLDRAFSDQSDIATEALLRCISRLPDKMKRVVRAGLDGVKPRVLAEEFTTSVGAIYNLHYRANKLLRDCVKQEIA